MPRSPRWSTPSVASDALKLTDEAWAVPVAEALARALDDARRPDGAGGGRRQPRRASCWPIPSGMAAGSAPTRWPAGCRGRPRPGNATGCGRPRGPDRCARRSRPEGPRPGDRRPPGGRPGDRAVPPRPGSTARPTRRTSGAGLGARRPGRHAVRPGARPAGRRRGAADRRSGPRRSTPWGTSAAPSRSGLHSPLVFDPGAPAALVARALPGLAEGGVLPPNDLAGFLDHADPAVRVAALGALAGDRGPARLPRRARRRAARRPGAGRPRRRGGGRRGDRPPAAVPGSWRSPGPRMSTDRPSAGVRALAAMPDPSALPIYLEALARPEPRPPAVGRVGFAGPRRRGPAAAGGVRRGGRARRAGRGGGRAGPDPLPADHRLAGHRPVRPDDRPGLPRRAVDRLRRTHSGVEGRTIAWRTARATRRPAGS